MAEDTNKKTGGESADREEKSWDWDAAAPQAPTDSFDIGEFSTESKAPFSSRYAIIGCC